MVRLICFSLTCKCQVSTSDVLLALLYIYIHRERIYQQRYRCRYINILKIHCGILLPNFSYNAMKSCYVTTCCVSVTLIPWILHWDMVHWDMDLNLQNGQMTFMSLYPSLVVLDVLLHMYKWRNFVAKIPRTDNYFSLMASSWIPS